MSLLQRDADVIVVGAGPSGATTAFYLAQAGLDVLLLEKSFFPRDKVCGDGLTPKAVREMLSMGLDVSSERGFQRNIGLRVNGGGHVLELPWPDLASYPNYGLASPRMKFDEMVARHAQSAGALLLEGHAVSGPVVSERTGRVIGVNINLVGPDGKRTGETRKLHAPLVVDAGGVAARLATAVGREKNQKRPMGVAIRTYYETPRHDDQYMESYLELWDGKPGESELLPGYGWVFPLGDGTANVGLGSVSSTAATAKLDYKGILKRWTSHTPAEWQFDEEHEIGKPRSAALPMAFNRKPLYGRGLMLIGDSAGMVSPFNGEGIAYGMAAGRVAADVIAQTRGKNTVAGRERVLYTYPQIMREELGGYYGIGRAFVKLIERPEILHICIKYGLPRPLLMKFTMRLLSDVYDPKSGDWADRLVHLLTKIAPAA